MSETEKPLTTEPMRGSVVPYIYGYDCPNFAHPDYPDLCDYYVKPNQLKCPLCGWTRVGVWQCRAVTNVLEQGKTKRIGCGLLHTYDTHACRRLNADDEGCFGMSPWAQLKDWFKEQEATRKDYMVWSNQVGEIAVERAKKAEELKPTKGKTEATRS